MARQHPEEPTLVEVTIEEVKAMGKQGLAHPSTRPVLTGGAVGAVIGAVLRSSAGRRACSSAPQSRFTAG